MTANRSLFVVGMPRSGTKLLRALIHQHPQVSILKYETNFLPYWVQNWQRFGDLSDRENFRRFYDEMCALAYFLLTKQDDGLIGMETWYDMCDDFSIQGVFDALARHDTGIRHETNHIWGDKSVNYCFHLEDILRHFPDTRIVHIVRDVRDHCLSVRKAWAKNIYRSAQRWTDNVAAALTTAKRHPERVLTVRFEDLLNDTAHELERVCSFLDIEFHERMTELDAPADPLGSVKAERSIVSSNSGKYVNEFRPAVIRRLEQISSDMLVAYGYPVSTDIRQRRVPQPLMLFYRLIDSFEFLRHNKYARRQLWSARHRIVRHMRARIQ